jgi:hypothetical protein
MYDEHNDTEKDIDWDDDILGNFSPGDYAIIDKGQLSEVKVFIVQLTEEGIWVRDKQGNEFSVNVLRLSKF